VKWSVLVGPALFVLACLVAGVRVLALGLRNGGIPERAIAVALLSAGVCGYSLIGGVPLLPGLAPANLHLASALGDLAISVGCVACCLFTWRTFRPDQTWAAGVFLGCTGVLAIGAVLGLARGSFALPYADRPLWFRAGLFAQWFAFAWTSWESLRYQALLRRRLRLGLADPEVVARILMWGVGSGCASLLLAMYAWLWLQRPGLVPSFEEVALIAVPGIGAAVSVWLAFFPPAAWRRRFSASAATPGPEA
jgi:hypothetical protein